MTTVRFGDALEPYLKEGDYTLTISQTLTTTDRRPVDEGYLSKGAKQQVSVRGPRFAVRPEWVHATYPAPGHAGLYDEVLPHIALSREVLPWERELGGSSGKTPTPWLAVLVFGERELADDPQCLGRVQPMTVQQLLTKEAGRPRPPELTRPVHAQELGDTCRTIVVREKLFRRLAPRRTELPALAHIRSVAPPADQVDKRVNPFPPGDYCVLIGNRLPRSAGGRYVAHLVSLEGWEKYLEAKDPDMTDGATLRLVSLWNWAFETLPDRQPGFTALVGHLTRADDDQLLRLPPPRPPRTPPEKKAHEWLKAGYVPTRFRLEDGTTAPAWYRGPCVPEPPSKTVVRHRSAADGLRYLKDQGVWDTSYAVAWNLGRAMALADPVFATALLRLRAKARKLARDGTRAWSRGPDAGEPPTARERFERIGCHRDIAAFLQHLHSARPAPQSADDATARTPAPDPRPRHLPRPGVPTDDPAYAAFLRAGLTPLTGTSERGPDDSGTASDDADDDYRTVRDWLVRLSRLEGVPFDHLVPSPGMLPAESLRFWHLDPQWLDTLARGALSVGQAHDFDATVDDLLFEDPGSITPSPRPAAGLLMRSALVAGWPGLGISATAAGKAVPMHRASRAPQVLLCVFDHVPETVTIAEPREAVHFGIDEASPTNAGDRKPPRKEPVLDNAVIRLRHLSGPKAGAESPFRYPAQGKGLCRLLRAAPAQGPDNVLNMDTLLAELSKRCIEAGLTTGRLTPAELGVQMFRAPKSKALKRSGALA
ncbi:hypothetical protein [Streptomyces roseifaciens]|uniref:hypothetical protein n=1 Tax=Streptomyces roseifaciens TaxID=1488406 RepID=UPI000717F831|nr:hypothetical protein [Streptomyces roseifaciens]